MLIRDCGLGTVQFAGLLLTGRDSGLGPGSRPRFFSPSTLPSFATDTESRCRVLIRQKGT